MKCEVLLFAQLRVAIGSDRLAIELREDAMVADALELLASRNNQIRDLKDRIAVAVNERYVRPEFALKDGDVLALIPPVSGG